jgi:hypothetical protein
MTCFLSASPSRFLHLFASALVAVGGTTAAPAADMTTEQRAFFENKIRPVLVKQCYECHSTGAKKIGGNLLLDAPAEMLVGGESGPALIPGKSDESLLIQALRYDGVEMPPKARLPEPVVDDFITWVNMGAPDPRPNLHGEMKPAKVTVEDKVALWAYQPLTHPTTPRVKANDWPHDPLDHFVLAKLEFEGLTPVGDAAPATLLRRLYFDLIGLPPAAEEMQAFTMASYEQVVDRLLASPHFGERWGRHWLDVARYGESNGNDGLSRNPSFPHAWRYRDYVIQAINEDTPYDRFLTEQIAGDLLPASTPAERDRHLVATAFLALGSKPAKAMNDNFEMDVVADQIGVIGQGIMGLTVACARCHDHKTDPIPTRDYYALAGIFRSTETLWGAAAYEGLTAPQTPLHELQAAPRVRPAVALLPASKKPGKAPAKPAFAYAPDAPLAMGVREGKTIADCKLNIDGESKKLGANIPRGFLSTCGPTAVNIAVDPKQSGRLQLAQWLTRPDHPLTSRVMVNRVWQQLFGEGIVRTPDDFGVYGERPTHPEMLDHLAVRFVKGGWSLKHFIRTVVLSRTYRLASACDPSLRERDPENRMLARHSRRRLDAEALRDAMLHASGALDAQPGRGSLIQHSDVLINKMGNLHQSSPHRSVYLLMLRNSLPPELTPFNMPDGTAVTGKRDVTTLPTQALYLLNNRFVVEQAQALADRVIASSAGDDDQARIRAAYRRTFAREPQPLEIDRARDFLRDADLSRVSAETDDRTRNRRVWAAFCQALLASNEFRYLD